MPTYHSPPQTPARFPLHRTPLPLSTSHFHPSSARNSNTSLGSKTPKHRSRKDDDDSQYKIPFVFLGSIAAASWLAHRFWPKGFPQGEKEDWELSDHARRAKQRREAEKAEMSARRADRRSSSMNRSNREPSTASDAFGKEDALRDYDSYRDREGEGRGGYYPSSKSRATANEDREVYKYRSQPPSPRPRYSSRSVDGYGAATNSNSRGGSSSSPVYTAVLDSEIDLTIREGA
ncbi:hypothetical protein N656DRAFT_802465 [Canariomyces notabilis]|uniref:Uncharacterized protein n=1 Tax=Canariomyces notabilis TaxID=2074819 RepID=A0AAN6QCL0_9PEZI|nr:hypothetical protein N656DRAFT_802465 [Canariomyces arenarius]